MSSRQIRIDYATFEAKRKLCKMFDVFLIDNKISSYLRPKLGKEFPKARKWVFSCQLRELLSGSNNSVILNQVANSHQNEEEGPQRRDHIQINEDFFSIGW